MYICTLLHAMSSCICCIMLRSIDSVLGVGVGEFPLYGPCIVLGRVCIMGCIWGVIGVSRSTREECGDVFLAVAVSLW